MGIQCNLSKEERDRVFNLFDGVLTLEEEEKIRDQFPQYLFFRMQYIDDGWTVREDPVRLCTCTACGVEFEGIRVNGFRGKVHNEPVTCPYCGRQLVGKAVGKYKYDMPSLENWIKTAVARRTEDGALLVEAGDARRRYTHDDLSGPIDWYPTARYYFEKGKVQMWKQIVMEWTNSKPVLNWQPTKTVCDPFPPAMYTYDGSYQIFGLEEAMRGTYFQYSQIEEYYRYSFGCDSLEEPGRWWVKYLAAAAFYPQIEFAVKWNLYDAIYDLISEGKKNARILNWSGTKPEQFMRMSKADAKAFVSSGMEFRDLKTWKSIPDMSIREYMEIRNRLTELSIRTLQECSEKAGCSFSRAFRYIESQLPECAKYAPPISTIITCWKDYLSIADQLGYDLAEKTVVMPKELQTRHDTAAAILKVKTEYAQQEKYRKRKKKLERTFAFSMAGFSIVVPESAEQIVQEGKTLHHCVGGYAARHMEGTTTILFLRKTRRPERSFLTIELYESAGKMKLKQIHGYKNEHYGEKCGTDKQTEFAWFIQPWLEWVNDGSKRDKRGNPIMEAVMTG